MTTPDPSSTSGAVEALAEPAAAPTPAAPVTERPRRRLPQALVSFEQADFRYLGLSTLALGFGQWAQQIGLSWLALELTGSAQQVTGVYALQSGISIVSAPVGGYFADRYPRRSVIVWSTAAAGLQASVLAGLAIAGVVVMWQVYVLALLGGLIQSITQPARQAFVYDISTDETLVNATAMNSIVQNLARIAGPPLAGAMIGAWGVGAPFAFIAVTKVIAVVLTLRISKRTRQIRVRGGANAARQLIEGFVATWQDKRVLGLIIVHTIPTLLVIPYLPLVSVVARDVLGQGALGYAWLSGMAGWGALLGLGVLAVLGDPKRKGWLMLIGFVVYIGGVLAFAFSHNFVLSLAALGIGGVFSSVAFALNNTLLQVATPNEVRGRVVAVWQVTTGLQAVGAPIMGYLVYRYGAEFGIGSLVTLALVAFLLFTAAWGSVRRM